ncbi:MAG: glycosyltransferase family 4 protein [bacterium]
MKILQIVDERWDSGIVNYALTLSNGLKDKGHEVIFAGLKGKSPIIQAQNLGLSTYEIKGFLPWLSLYRHVSTFKPDIINVHTGRAHLWAVLFVGTRARIIRTRCDIRLPASSILKRAVLSRTHRIIAPSRFIQKAYEKIFPQFNKKMISLIPQGIDASAFTYLPEPPADTLIKIAVVARLDPVKGHRFLIEAMASVVSAYPRVKLLVIGKEEQVTIETLRAYAQSLGIQHNVDFLGYSHSVKLEMQNCHIGVISSISSEAVSRAVLEWMASGRAVVATCVGGIPDIISHELTGLLVEPARPLEMAQAIKRLIRDSHLRTTLGKYARKSIETTFSLKHFIKHHEVVYEDAIKHPAY